MGEPSDIRDTAGNRLLSAVNTGWTAKVKKERFSVQGLTLLRCPKCKKPLGETDGNRFSKRCESCGRWMLLAKAKAQE